MYYKYTIYRKNGTKLSGYAYSEVSREAVRDEVERRSFGEYKLRVVKLEGRPPINSDYILWVD